MDEDKNKKILKRKKQTQIELEIKTTASEMKNTLHGINSRLRTAGERLTYWKTSQQELSRTKHKEHIKK